MTEITNYDDFIDSRDVIAEIETLEGFLQDAATDPADYDRDEVSEAKENLKVMKALEDEASGTSDWQYGATLIRDTYFKEYAQNLAEDIGAINRDVSWPYDYIDWDMAADALKQDYFSVDFDGIDYWIRA